MTAFTRWVESHRGGFFRDYRELWEWSVECPDEFWPAIWDYFDVPGEPGPTVIADRTMPGAEWFPGTTLNYASMR